MEAKDPMGLLATTLPTYAIMRTRPRHANGEPARRYIIAVTNHLVEVEGAASEVIQIDQKNLKTISITQKTWEGLRQSCTYDGISRIDAEAISQTGENLTPQRTRSAILSLRRLGLIDENCELTMLGLRWATEKGYADACREIADKCFPASIIREVEADNQPDMDRLAIDYAMAIDCGMSVARANTRFLKFLLGEARRTWFTHLHRKREESAGDGIPVEVERDGKVDECIEETVNLRLVAPIASVPGILEALLDVMGDEPFDMSVRRLVRT